jgi:limonene-1,2-epoxide hydrolase
MGGQKLAPKQDMSDDNIATVEKYIWSLKKGDLTAAPFADDIRFEDPVAGKGVGAEDFRAFLGGFLGAIIDIRITRHVAEGEFVTTQWEIDAIFGTIPILELFRIRDGKIVESTAYFDPRPVLGG